MTDIEFGQTIRRALAMLDYQLRMGQISEMDWQREAESLQRHMVIWQGAVT